MLVWFLFVSLVCVLIPDDVLLDPFWQFWKNKKFNSPFLECFGCIAFITFYTFDFSTNCWKQLNKSINESNTCSLPIFTKHKFTKSIWSSKIRHFEWHFHTIALLSQSKLAQNAKIDVRNISNMQTLTTCSWRFRKNELIDKSGCLFLSINYYNVSHLYERRKEMWRKGTDTSQNIVLHHGALVELHERIDTRFSVFWLLMMEE